MADTPAVAADGFCTNAVPVKGSARTANTAGLGSKFYRLHGRPYGDCPCGRQAIGLNGKGRLYRHKPPQEE
ncbi:hypothetical protein [Streptomyces sp. NPDC094468]|uniref:hypothetical protein n=1 Tax=Streptomyces sp. NPDC094468 TaxID=3366066 RepID=UPI00380AF6A4